MKKRHFEEIEAKIKLDWRNEIKARKLEERAVQDVSDKELESLLT